MFLLECDSQLRGHTRHSCPQYQSPSGPPKPGAGRRAWDHGAYVSIRHRPETRPCVPATPTNVPEPSRTDPALIRNFCIIAHIDHGKSTLADRMLQLTGVVDQRQMRAQYLDRMDIERERGITIKSQAVRLPWAPTDGQGEGRTHILNMIDTPGHVDFTYEVSRSLAACEGTVLLVDAAQGIEAQTLANLYLAMENDLTIVPVLNKIDLPAAQPEKFSEELANLIGCQPEDVLKVSAKTGMGVEALLDRVVRDVPAPVGVADAPARAMIFDSVYDSYRGVVTYVRVVDGQLNKRERIKMMSTGATHELLEIGVSSPEMTASDGLGVGEVGYLITGVKDVRQSKVGDTITSLNKGATEALGGYKDPKPMVFSGLYPLDGSEYPDLREALDKLQLNDAALVYEPETSAALGFGFRVGFLGLLHLDVIRERLEREFGLDLIATAPNVVYRVVMEDGSEHTVTNPSEFPEGKIDDVYEPVVRATILAPSEFIGAIMELCQTRRGTLIGMDYLSEDRVEIRYTLPLAEIVFDFFDQLKSKTRGYASLDYEPTGEQASSLVKVDILLHGDKVDAFSAVTHKDAAYAYGVRLVAKLRELIPRQAFEVPIQAAIGSRVIARETIRAIRKDVLAKCYGGDISRKRKLLEKQKEGKKRMKMVGSVEVPQEAFIAVLSSDESSGKKK
ncbi:elongation factor 4 [Streptomyces gardneri]|uniref:Elongation factor 4 n=1 Tax=Streptomyces gardneri TaxID=66892 RepID=A0A4Y3RS30_9ACTN|nr:elongation factor 4 [Streptomyces gardneri]GHG82407.1 elongation factor 4 [Streptomyces gardneri]